MPMLRSLLSLPRFNQIIQRQLLPSILKRFYQINTNSGADDDDGPTTSMEGVWFFQSLTHPRARFPVQSRDVYFMKEPSRFFEQLKNGIRSARKRIVLASLYFGTGTHEQELVSLIDQAMERHNGLEVKVLLDFQRGQRGGVENSSVGILRRLKEKYPLRFHLSLYHTPDLHGISKAILPDRFNETIGLMHMKAYVFDNDMIISGANLSDSYFVDRQDRYVLLREMSALASYFVNLSNTISSFSYTLGFSGNFHVTPPQIGVEPAKDPRKFKELARNRMLEFFRVQQEASVAREESGENAFSSTFIVPLVQIGPLDIRYDEAVTSAVLSASHLDPDYQSGHVVHITSGYFNMTHEYTTLLLKNAGEDPSKRKRFHILTASPEANGFFQSKGVSKYIPYAYTFIEKNFLQKVQSMSLEEHVSLYEYRRPGWTFHAKGIWYRLSAHQLPCMTLIGSPNYGYRSVHRDVEAQIMITTADEQLQHRLEDERQHLFENAQQVSYSSLVADPTRSIPAWVPFVTRIIQPYF